jgi:hypothetical protein
MDFEEMLAALLGMFGRRVDVTVMSRSPRSMVAAFSGRLVRGADLGHPGGPLGVVLERPVSL